PAPANAPRPPCFLDGAACLPGVTGWGLYLERLAGTTCQAEAAGVINGAAGAISFFVKPLRPWNSRTVGDQYEFLFSVNERLPNGKSFAHDNELRLSYVSGCLQVVAGVPYDGSRASTIQAYCSLAPGRWRHLCVTWSQTGGAAVLYLDGVEIGRCRMGAQFAPRDALLSVGCLGGNYQAEGVLDDFRVYKRALTASEVQSLAAACP
ncbi:MAG: LamG domain-containing protein, partial [Armatimonadetes bacterium]|nr:LamG domain-containing protein [Armatimonadota bacterium]